MEVSICITPKIHTRPSILQRLPFVFYVNETSFTVHCGFQVLEKYAHGKIRVREWYSLSCSLWFI